MLKVGQRLSASGGDIEGVIVQRVQKGSATYNRYLKIMADRRGMTIKEFIQEFNKYSSENWGPPFYLAKMWGYGGVSKTGTQTELISAAEFGGYGINLLEDDEINWGEGYAIHHYAQSKGIIGKDDSLSEEQVRHLRKEFLAQPEPEYLSPEELEEHRQAFLESLNKPRED